MPGQRPGPIEHTRSWLPTPDPRVGGSIVLATLVHGVVGLAFLSALASPRYFDWLVLPRTNRDTTMEHVRYVDLTTVAPPPAAMLPEPVHTLAIAARVEPPRAAIPRSAKTVGEAGNAPFAAASPSLVDTGYAVRADDSGSTTRVVLRPASADPRIWSARSGTSPESLSPSRSTTSAQLDAAAHAGMLRGRVARGIAASNDSIAALGVQTVRPDWVMTRADHSYGMDNTTIHLGKVEIPAVLLGLLPINGFGCMPTMYFPDRAVRDSMGISCIQLENPTVAERNERIAEMSAEIHARAPLALSEREEIARIAARKDRERDARARAQGSTSRPP